VLFAEGGGGRPGDTERLGVTGLDVPTFGQFAKLSGLVPLVGVVSGRCFAGNAALLGCCDVIIATKDTTLAWRSGDDRRRWARCLQAGRRRSDEFPGTERRDRRAG